MDRQDVWEGMQRMRERETLDDRHTLLLLSISRFLLLSFSQAAAAAAVARKEREKRIS